MEVAEAFSLIDSAIDSGRAAHGYLIVGNLKGSGLELCDQILRRLFPNALAQLAAHAHPDVFYLKPTGAKRIITVDDMRDKIVIPTALGSYSGGWKVGVIVGADRMEAPSANAFLKSLEEPTPKTMYLLLTEQPDSILPTIVSRTQRIDLPLSEEQLEGEEYEEVAAAFAKKDAARLAKIFDALKDEAEDEDWPLVRRRFFQTIMGFVRQLMLGDRLPRYQAFRNVEAVEMAFRQSERSLKSDAVLAFMLDRITM